MQNKLFDKEFFQKLNRLRMKSSLNSTSAYAGLRKSSAKGNSVEFSDYREYLQGDDVRRIDWNAYARLDRHYVKLFQEEREGNFTILLDCSASMNYGQKSKIECAAKLAGMFAYLVLNSQDRLTIQLTGTDEAMKQTQIQGVTGATNFFRVLNFLEQIQNGTTLDFMEAVKKQKLLPGGTVILISDFLDTEGLEECLKYLRFYKKQEVIVAQVLAREEAEPEKIEEVLAGKGQSTLQLMDAETGNQMRVTITPALLRTYRKTYQKFIHTLEQMTKQYQCKYKLCFSDAALEVFLLSGMREGWMEQ